MSHHRGHEARPLLIVCSTGGHLLQMQELREAWEPFERVWVTFDKSDSRSLLRDERVLHAYGPTNRNIPNLLRNLRLAVARAAARAAVGDPHHRRRRGRAVRLDRQAARHPDDLRRERHADRGALAQRPHDRPGGHSACTRSGPSSPSPPRAASASPATSSRPDDPRHRRHPRAAVRPPGRGGRRARRRRAPGRPVRHLEDHRRPAASGSTSCRSTSSPSRRAAPAWSSRTPASARSCSPAATATARSSCRAARTSASTSTSTRCSSPGGSREAGIVTVVEDAEQLAAAVRRAARGAGAGRPDGAERAVRAQRRRARGPDRPRRRADQRTRSLSRTSAERSPVASVARTRTR